jgi:hypothetical protein
MLWVLRIGRHGIVDLSHHRPAAAGAAAAAEATAADETPVYYLSDGADGADGCQEAVRVVAAHAPCFRIECDSQERDVVLGTLCKVGDIPADAVRCAVATPTANRKLVRVDAVYGRCKASMEWLDTLYREYVVDRHVFKTRSLAIRSVAGSGKTTTLIELAKNFKEEQLAHPDLRTKAILYVAFNKQLVEEIRTKLHANGIQGALVPMTFDALVKRVAEARFARQNQPFHLTGSLTPFTLTAQYDWFRGKAYKMKKSIIDDFNTFCQDPHATHPRDLFPTKKTVQLLWEDTLNGTFLTFGGLRKRAHLEHWMRDVIDTKYARVFVDEAQDFDPIMLEILKNDSTVPKVFVGDPRQQIYEWRGTINAFEHLPEHTLTLEFYKTFRMGEPAASEVSRLTHTNMISGADPNAGGHATTLHQHVTHASMPPDLPYTYLFRTWRGLLTTAQTLSEVLPPGAKLWVHDFERQMANIESLHEKLLAYGATAARSGDSKEDDALPAFLMKLSSDELRALKEAIESRRVVDKSRALCKLYTIHSFKGLEDDVVRVCGDIHPQEEPNLHYVAVTRGRKQVYVDVVDETLVMQKQTQTQTQKDAQKGAAGGYGGGTKTQAQKDDASALRRLKQAEMDAQFAGLTGHKKQLADALFAFRKQRSTDLQKPAYTVMTNKVLFDIVQAVPRSAHELGRIKGVGQRSLEDIGQQVLELCAG